MKINLVFILIFSFYSIGTASKKETLLGITKKYLPDNYVVLENYDDATINFLAEGDSVQDYFINYPTIIHEAFHVYEHSINSYKDSLRLYRLDDTLTIAIKKFNSFPSHQLNNIVPASLRIKVFRYDTYINSKDMNDGTQQSGFLGLLEEYAAYYQSLKAYTASFYFLQDSFGWNNPLIWVKYLNVAGSEIYAINEFKLFFSWYLQYSKIKRPDIFKKITSDRNIRLLFRHVEKNSRKLVSEFLKNRTQILKLIKPVTEIKDGFIYLKGEYNGYGYGIDEHIKNLEFTESLLSKPEHRVLQLLRQ